MPDVETTQMNVMVPRDVDDALERLGERFGSKRKAATLAIRALEVLMDAHERFAAQYDDDIGALYMQLATEAPAAFVEVPKDGVKPARVDGGVPTVRVGDWLIFPDLPEGFPYRLDAPGVLLAAEQTGERRIGRVVDGEIRPLRLPTAGEVAQN